MKPVDFPESTTTTDTKLNDVPEEISGDVASFAQIAAYRERSLDQIETNRYEAPALPSTINSTGKITCHSYRSHPSVDAAQLILIHILFLPHSSSKHNAHVDRR